MAGFAVHVENYENINPKYLCGKCTLIARRAVQTGCGHLYCSTCIISELRKGPTNCLKCRTMIKPEEVFRDRIVERDILQLVLCCSNHGCPWNGKLRSLKNHESLCDFTLVTCVHQDCGKQVTRAGLADHLQHECLYREELCSYCEQPIVYKFWKDLSRMNAQIQEAKEYTQKLECRLESQDQEIRLGNLVIADLQTEIENLKGRKIKELEEPSRNASGNLHSELQFSISPIQETLHRANDAAEAKSTGHEVLVVEMHTPIEELRREQERSNTKLQEAEEHIRRLERRLESQNQAVGLCNLAIADLHKEIENFEDRRIKELEERSQNVSGNPHSKLQFSKSPIQETLHRVNNAAEAKSTDHEVLVAEMHTPIEEQERSNTKLQEAEEHIPRRLESRLESQDQAVCFRNLAIADLEEMINQVLEGVSFDGVSMWKIENVAQKRNDARTGRLVSFYSQCFYTGPHGYKMCARIYLNGDGMGKGTHISLLFVLMRGNYDALLHWPFRQKVTLMLLDQDNEEHIIDAFRPDPESSSFQKPRTEMNIPYGWRCFCSHVDLQRHAYIRDDTMFIKIIVDKPDLN